MSAIDTEVNNGVAVVTMERPPVNALDLAGWRELADTFVQLGQDFEVRAVVLTARGRGFNAGVDIKELAADGSLITAVNRACYLSFAAIYDCPVPVIAAVHRYALGGGVALAGSCDMVVADEGTEFGMPEIDRGALGGGTHLIRMFPQQKARMMMFTGKSIDAAEAYRLGALEEVTPVGGALDGALAIAEEIATKSGVALRLAKQSLNGIELLDIKRSYRFEQGFTLELYTSPDSQEARDAFVDKRDARFSDDG
jgi:enoyl-CoA hydratase